MYTKKQRNASALFNRGSALDSLGLFDDAIADFTKALELDMAAGGSSLAREPLP